MNRIKKILLTLTVMLLVAASVSPGVFALDSNIDQYNEEFEYEAFLSELDDDTARILNEIGISELSFDAVFSVSPDKVLTALFSIAEDSVKEPLTFLTVSIGIGIVMSLAGASVKDSRSTELVGGGALSLCIAVPVAETVTMSFSVLETLNAFTTAFSGVFCAVVSSAGGVVSGISHSALTVFINGFFSGLLSAVSKPLINSMCSMGFLSCFDSQGLLSHLTETVKKVYVFLLSFIGTVFSGIVTLKGVLSEGSDNLTSRSVRFVVGRALPVVGGTVSETYSSLVSGLSLIKSTVGVFGIITVVVIVLPTLIRLLMWIMALEISHSLLGVMGASVRGNLFVAIKDSMVLLAVTVVVVVTVFIVSVGVVISAGGSGV